MPPAATHPGQTIRQKAKAGKGQQGQQGSRDVVKPVLANPFTVAWPSLPNHLQAAVFAALPGILPPEIADYHVSRQRCSRAVKKRKKADKDKGEGGGEVPPSPPHPELLSQLVFGLNETIKALEHGIADLKFRIMVMSDALQGKPVMPRAVAESGLLPTAPPSDTPAPEPAEPATPASPLAYVLVPNLSVSPQSLIDPLPPYCATYNTHLDQYTRLAAEVHRRLPKPEGIAPPAGPQVRLVPIGKREAELSAMAGLRRVSTFAIRTGHPGIDGLERLLPNSVLPPPRHSMTLPFPASALAVVDGKKNTPAITYPPLHVKAIHTTAPIDTSARKNTRLLEVRRKRVENKEKRAAARKALERTVGGGKPGARAARIAAKSKAAMNVDVAA